MQKLDSHSPHNFDPLDFHKTFLSSSSIPQSAPVCTQQLQTFHFFITTSLWWLIIIVITPSLHVNLSYASRNGHLQHTILHFFCLFSAALCTLIKAE
jgi:hypothetical protein